MKMWTAGGVELKVGTYDDVAKKTSGRRYLRSQRTRYKLLKAARKVFDAKGFLDATVDDITREAQLSRGAFYIYFENKLDIFRSLVEEFLEEMSAEIEAPWRSRDVLVAIEGTVRGFLQAAWRRRDIVKVLFEVSAYNEEVAAERRKLREKLLLGIRTHLAESHAAGLTRPINLDLMAYILGGMIEHQAYLTCSYGQEHDPEEVIQTLTGVWYHAVYCRASPQLDQPQPPAK